MLAKNAFKKLINFGILVSLLIFIFNPASVAALEIDPTSAQEWFNAGIKQIERENYQQALLDFDRAIALNRDFTAAYSNRCLIQIHLNDYLQAKQDCTQALQQNANASAYLNRGLATYRLGDYQSAIADYNAAIQLEPNSVSAYYNRGLAYAAQENYMDAIADYNRAFSVMSAPDNFQLATIYNDRGLAYFSLGNFELAIADFDRAIRFDTNNALAYFNRACACQRQGHYQEAIHHFTLALQRDPNRAEAYVSRGLIRHQLGDRRTALEDLRLGAECFCQQGQLVAYQQILKLIGQIQHSFSDFESIIV